MEKQNKTTLADSVEDWLTTKKVCIRPWQNLYSLDFVGRCKCEKEHTLFVFKWYTKLHPSISVSLTSSLVEDYTDNNNNDNNNNNGDLCCA